MKIILHIDLDQFFVRCEEIKNPSLENKPVGIGHSGRGGIISTCSYKAREYGVRSGMPTFQATKLCKDLILIPPDSKFIKLMSREFFNFISTFTSKIQILGCDECFADFTDYFKIHKINDAEQFFKNIQTELFKKTGLKCSIGVSITKFLAKMASDIHKPMGLTIIRKKDIKNLIFPLKISDYYGIGKKTAPKLTAIGVKTIGDLYDSLTKNDPKVIDLIGNFKDAIIEELEGRSSDEIELDEKDPKSIGHSKTLEFDTSDTKFIIRTLTELTKDVIKQLKEQSFLCKTFTITLKDAVYESGFKTNTYSFTLDEFTDDEAFLIDKITDFFILKYNEKPIRLIGISLKNFISKYDSFEQLTIFNYEKAVNESKSFNIVNDLNRKFNDKVFIRLSDLKGDKDVD